MRPRGPLEHIVDRIHSAAMRMDITAARLRDHADAVHGSVPETACEVSRDLCGYSGLIGEIFAALDRLERAHDYVADQVDRNTSLA